MITFSVRDMFKRDAAGSSKGQYQYLYTELHGIAYGKV